MTPRGNRSITIIYAHPYAARSRAGRALLEGVRDLPGVTVRTLYSLYPDFDVDAEAEQQALLACDIVVWQGPLYWYGVPALMNLWFEKVLTHGWAYGEGAVALHDKAVLWVATTGAPASAYRPGGMHGHHFDAFVPAISQTVRFCGMRWLDPVILHAAHRISPAELHRAAQGYRQRLEALASEQEGERPHG